MTIVPPDLLPSSLPTIRRGGIYRAGQWWTSMYCMSCGAESPYRVPEGSTTGAYYICDGDCAERWQRQFDVLLVPDEVHWETARQAQLEHDGRLLTADETAEALASSDHYLSKIARSRP